MNDYLVIPSVETKYDVNKIEFLPKKIEDTERILRKLFPGQDEQWIELSNLTRKEMNYLE